MNYIEYIKLNNSSKYIIKSSLIKCSFCYLYTKYSVQFRQLLNKINYLNKYPNKYP